MYNTSLKRKWDNKNIMDYAVAEGEARGEKKGKHKKSFGSCFRDEKRRVSVDQISKIMKLSVQEIEAL